MQVDTNLSGAVRGRSSAVTQDFETFLRMLTTQIQNQDPLSPMEADQFASQLASFSMVEQQTLTNQRLKELSLELRSDGISSYAPFVGTQILHEGPFSFTGAAVLMEIRRELTDEDGLKLSIFSGDGIVVSETVLSDGQSQFNWDGTDGEGILVKPGLYSAEIRRVSDDAEVEATVVASGLVEELRFGSADVEFILANGSIVTESSVVGVRLPE